MLQFNIPVLAMLIVDMIVFLSLLKTVYRQIVRRMPKAKRAQSNVRKKFKTVQETAKFYAWREYIKNSLIEIEKQKILDDDQDQKIYYSI
ncbi:hypothetical protein ACR788_21660 [Sphingobacterium siyangense]|uniref:hypothetical protein n=1 Tax=Sphingobacterium TaxID=28453 RepID=UPI00191A31E1|nr:hypothetical protein [Sphingobacterium multivorum]QQT60041.1 hypothetical protein I6I97_12260 [Sphingobacterium multivorum]